ncbi:transposase [Arthrobacter sp. RIT-PI-e]|uniref:recombinase family protein n=1 Tax=Arthrobacter sp. RIT-PI-e TaxID=1681197 RepID=UPI000675D4AC|nr:recombinase family protein [Arthrobacter sp. RIT-PI-e]KNC18858.1 transposase [Arthrobacter sp. RIT-PI-e]
MVQHIGQRIGYARVSSVDQNLARQLSTLGTVDRLFEEKQSGAQRSGRSALADLIGYSRQGDTVVVSSMDRLARSVVDLNQIVGELTAKGVSVEFIAERVTFTPGGRDPFAEFQLNIMASFAQLERAITRERQADGIKAAKERGAYTGRTRKLTADQLTEAVGMLEAKVPKAEIARRLGIDRTTLYRTLSRAEVDQ